MSKSKPHVWKVNDAAWVPSDYGEYKLERVVAVFPDGRPMREGVGGRFAIEGGKSVEWQYAGRFRWSWLPPRWVFEPAPEPADEALQAKMDDMDWQTT